MSSPALESGGGGTGVLVPPDRRPAPPPPPDDVDEGGGNGDGDEDGEDPRAGAPEFALRLGLVAVSALFLVFLALLWRTRARAPSWPPPGAPAPPSILWGSTLLLAASSASLSRAALLAQRGAQRTGRWLRVTLLLGLAFLACQVLAGVSLVGDGLVPRSSGYGASFFALTGLHGVHVLGGLVYLGHLALRRSAGPERVRLAGVYWHFMGVLWLAVFALLWWPAAGAAP